MHLISTLASGVKGAESGTAEIYVRGTSTRATYYTAFEVGTTVSSGADVSLDSNGGAEVYVNQYVDVVVKNSAGVIVRTFTEGKAAPLTEYIGQSFTGVDYTTGASAASKPVTLQAILDAWYTSAGALDFNVLLEGASTSIQAALGTVAGYFFNVKSDAYGAEGDGTTDDTTAINAAVAAATVNGGIVFFPDGTYRVTTSIALPPNVSLMGLGSDISILTMDHASNDLLTLSGNSTGQFQHVKGIGFTASQSYSGHLLYGVTEETYVKFQECFFGGSYTTGSIIDIDINNAIVQFESCWFEPGDIPINSYGVQVESDGADEDMMWSSFIGCHFRVSTTQTSDAVELLRVASSFISGCRFDCSTAVPIISIACIRFYATAVSDIQGCTVVGNYFIGSSVAIVQAMEVQEGNNHLYESGNHFSDDLTLYGTSELDSGGGSVQSTNALMSREHRFYDYSTDNSAAIRLNAMDYGMFRITRSDATALSLTADVMPTGSWLTLVIQNSNGGGATGNITLSTNDFAYDTGVFTVAASSIRVLTFRSVMKTGVHLWGQVEITGDI